MNKPIKMFIERNPATKRLYELEDKMLKAIILVADELHHLSETGMIPFVEYKNKWEALPQVIFDLADNFGPDQFRLACQSFLTFYPNEKMEE